MQMAQASPAFRFLQRFNTLTSHTVGAEEQVSDLGQHFGIGNGNRPLVLDQVSV